MSPALRGFGIGAYYVTGRLITAVRFRIKLLAEAAIIAGLSAICGPAWTQTQEAAAEVQKAAIEDHSYLPSSMRGKNLPANAVPPASPRKEAKRAQRRVKRRYTEASEWSLFGDER